MTVVRFSDVYSCLEPKGIIRDYSVAPTSQVPTVVHGFVLLNVARNDPRFRSLDRSFVIVPLEKEKKKKKRTPASLRVRRHDSLDNWETRVSRLLYRHYAEDLLPLHLSRRHCNGILRYLTLHVIRFI